jgi:serine/threonine protein kinase
MQPAAPEVSTCPNCGSVLEKTASGELGCMSCLLRGGIGSEEETVHGSTTDAPEGSVRFGVYKVDRREDGSLYELGRGAMGVTYRATDTSLQRKVALKIIKTDIAERSTDARERFMREARAAAALRHENIAVIHQFGMRLETGQYFYAMELIEGETLDERVRRAGPLDARTTIAIARQVTSALAAAEKRGLIHRDLKPANLMLLNADDVEVVGASRRALPTVKIIDFGLAKAVHAQTDLKSLTHDRFVGTPAFASPEQFEHSTLDVRSDIYSLGVTLWFALTGKTPFGGRSVEEIHRSQRSDALPIEQLKAAHVPSRLRSLLESMLALEPAARPGIHYLAAQLRVVLRAVPSKKPIEKAGAPVRSRRFLATICIFCTALVMSLRFVPALPVLSHVWGHEQRLQDWLHRTGRRTATHPELVFVALSTKSLATPEAAKAAKDPMLRLMAEHPFPWSREVWARILDRLFESGARLVIVDLIFNPPREGDQIFRAALDRYRDRVVIPSNIDLEKGNELVVPNADLIPPPAQYDDRVGFVTFWPDQQDGLVRAARFFTSDRQLAGQKPSPTDVPWASLIARAMEKLGRSNDLPHDLKDHLIRFSADDAYQPHPIWEIADPDTWHSKYSDGEFFEDKIVIVGPSARGVHDVFDNPIGPEIKGPVMLLNVLAATMDHEFLRKLPVALDLLIVAVFGLLAWLLLGYVGRWLICLLSFLGFGIAYLLLAFLFYNFLGIFVPIVPPLLTLLVCGLLGFIAQQIPKRSHGMVHG